MGTFPVPPTWIYIHTNLLALTSSKIDFFLYGVPTVSSKKQNNETGTEWKPNTGSKPTFWNSMSLEFHFHWPYCTAEIIWYVVNHVLSSNVQRTYAVKQPVGSTWFPGVSILRGRTTHHEQPPYLQPLKANSTPRVQVQKRQIIHENQTAYCNFLGGFRKCQYLNLTPRNS